MEVYLCDSKIDAEECASVLWFSNAFLLSRLRCGRVAAERESAFVLSTEVAAP